MSNLTRRQILLGGSAVAAASLIPAVPKTPLTPQMRMMAQAVAADISRPDYIIRLSSNENPYGPSRVALQAIDANMHRTNRYNMQGERSLAEVIARINFGWPKTSDSGLANSELSSPRMTWLR